jgi:tetratricopeptide (TPR) repeat protein
MTMNNFEQARQLFTQGIACLNGGHYAEAELKFQQSLALLPDRVSTLTNLATTQILLNKFSEARASAQAALSIEPNSIEGWLNLGRAEQHEGRFREALGAFRQALALGGPAAMTWKRIAAASHAMGDCEAALQGYQTALEHAADDPEALANMGALLNELGRFNEALQYHDRALRLNAGNAQVLSNKGAALQALGQLDAAMVMHEQALAADPAAATAWSNKGVTLYDLGRFEEAVVHYDRALALKPDYAEAHSNRGLALKALKRLGETVESCERAIALKPDFAEAWSNRGLALQAQGQLDAAIASYDRAIVLKPEFAEANWNLALTLLLKEEGLRGWSLYEWGFKAGKRGGGRQQALAPEWDGEPLQGSLLVLPEQGVGDEIFYSGMLNDLRGRTKTITVCVDPRLVPLYQRSFAHVHVLSSRDLAMLPPHDAQIYMASLGQYFRQDSNGLKAVRTPYLKASAERAQALRQRIAGKGKRICGLSWISKSQVVGEDKSLRLADLQPLLELPDVVFVDLQYGDTSAERAALLAATGIEVMRIPEIDNFNDIDGLAALMTACDVVVTVSNTTAHLAGALGRPLMVMLPQAFGLVWYWHVGRTDSPWYPGAKLFRQQTPGQWGSVINEVSTALRVFADASSGAPGFASPASAPTATG